MSSLLYRGQFLAFLYPSASASASDLNDTQMIRLISVVSVVGMSSLFSIGANRADPMPGKKERQDRSAGIFFFLRGLTAGTRCGIDHLLLTFCMKSLIFLPADLQMIYMREAMKEKKTDLLQGTLDMLVLKALALGPMHGLGVSNRIAQITQGVFQVKPGSLFPALHRMEEAGWLESSWGESENNRRAKYYRLTKAGQRQLKTETEDWQRISLAIASALQAS
jgi:PadR family transcriptional regulator, regulatory protein PadR